MSETYRVLITVEGGNPPDPELVGTAYGAYHGEPPTFRVHAVVSQVGTGISTVDVEVRAESCSHAGTMAEGGLRFLPVTGRLGRIVSMAITERRESWQ